MRVGIKYCGGCNPRYDRTGVVARLKADFPEIAFVSAYAPDLDFALIVCGCTSACAEHANILPRLGKFVLTQEAPEEYAALCRALRGALASKEK